MRKKKRTNNDANAQRRLAPKKSLGQNFLKDVAVAQRIVDSLPCNENTVVVEIGPGEGALTELLLQKVSEGKAHSLHAIEFDRRAVELLEKKFSQQRSSSFTLHESDVRRFNWHLIHSSLEPEQNIVVIGNIPYYATSDILFTLFALHEDIGRKLSSAVIMMQKEVAQRLTADVRTKAYGILTIATSMHAQIVRCFDVAPSCFFPVPKVTSTVLRANFHEVIPYQYSYSILSPLVKQAFQQRRKMLRNNISQYVHLHTNGLSMAQALEKAREANLPFFTQRPEELTPKDFCQLYSFIHSIT